MNSICLNSLASHSTGNADLLNHLELQRGRSSATPVARSQAQRRVVETFRDGHGELIHVKIGNWRVLSSDTDRRISEVRELSCQRVAVRVELVNHGRLASHCTIWELYDHQGHLLAVLQDLGDREIWLTTGFRRLHANQGQP